MNPPCRSPCSWVACPVTGRTRCMKPAACAMRPSIECSLSSAFTALMCTTRCRRYLSHLCLPPWSPPYVCDDTSHQVTERRGDQSRSLVGWNPPRKAELPAVTRVAPAHSDVQALHREGSGGEHHTA